MKTKNICRTTYVACMLALLSSCYDTRSYEEVRKLKTGMTIEQVESIMGGPFTYVYVNDSMEGRTYAYDIPHSGFDTYIRVIYTNDTVVHIKDHIADY